MDDPISAAAANQTDVLKLIKPFFANLAVDTTVPMTEHILLLPRDRWAGIPAIIKAGREIRPPPPAIESISPARNTRGHTIKY